MKKIFIILTLCVGTTSFAQQADISIAKGLGMYVFPAQDQDKDQQEFDEYKCYKWAIGETGTDPLNLPEIKAEQVDAGPDGAAVGGAARGAAAGAAIGAIAGDAGKGAAIGATAGALRGRRASRYRKAKKQKQNEAAAKKAEEDRMNDFKKAFSVCMTGKGYTIQ